MFERVKAFLDSHGLSPDDASILVAVSGGLDSTVLLSVLNRLGYQVAVAHMNFGLRGEESDDDESFIQNYCEMAQITFHTKKVAIDVNSEGSVQMQARVLRYAWFEELIELFDYSVLATAHHFNDSLETGLLQLTKGTGIAGIAGIPERVGDVIRPFSKISRAEIKEYAAVNGLTWREDASNSDSKYQRNKIRNKVIPLLEEINPSLIQTYRNTLERLQGVSALLNREVERIHESHLTKGENDTLNLSWYSNDTIGWTLLSELLKPYGVGYDLAKDIGQRHSSGKLFYTKTSQILFDRNSLIISPIDSPSVGELTISSMGNFQWGKLGIGIKKVLPADFKMMKNKDWAFLDSSIVDFPIRVRQWNEGDWFVPLGMNGKKKLSDFMIDNKIALTLKPHIPVFESNKGIFWVGGFRIDDRFKVTEKTKECIRIKLFKSV